MVRRWPSATPKLCRTGQDSSIRTAVVLMNGSCHQTIPKMECRYESPIQARVPQSNDPAVEIGGLADSLSARMTDQKRIEVICDVQDF